MTDLFEEVEEQLRSDRYQALVRKAAPWVLAIAAAALIGALGFWGWQQYRLQTTDKASMQYAAALADEAHGDPRRARGHRCGRGDGRALALDARATVSAPAL